MAQRATHCVVLATGNHHKRQSDTCSLLQATWQRAAALTDAERIITLTDHPQLGAPGAVVQQPADKGTATSMALALTPLMREAPDDLVVILPGDQFLYPQSASNDYVRQALGLAQSNPDKVVLMAALPQDPEGGYGWIAKGSNFNVAGYHEKPGPSVAARYFEQGYFWSTMICVARVKTLWSLLLPHLPQACALFQACPRLFRPTPMFNIQFKQLPARDFATDVLESAIDRLLCVPMYNLLWSGSGHPDRVLSALIAMNMDPNASSAPRQRRPVPASSA